VSPDSRLREAGWIAALLGLLVAAGLLRPLMPVDETRYASVAWEMWSRGDFLVPVLNGEVYHHKPPLLFWLIHAGWAVFGVNEWWPRLISPLFAAGTLLLAHRLGGRLWPQRPDVARMVPFIVLASLLFSYYASALMFDAILSFFVTLGWLGLVHAWHTGAGAGGFALLSLGLGGALYAKGPVALLHLLPLALFAPWWMVQQRPRWRRWYAGVLLATLGAAAAILAWAVPAAIAGGAAYRNAIFWGQTAGRMVESFAHRAPWWYYLALLPLLLAPWLVWPRWWAGLERRMADDSGVRFAAGGALFCLVAFSLVSAKHVHYLLPEFVLFALVAARALDRRTAGRWSLALPSLTLFVIGAAALAAAAVPAIAARLGSVDGGPALYAAGALAIAAALVLVLRRPAAALVDVRRIATATIVATTAVLTGFNVALRETYDIGVVAGKLAQFEREGRPLAVEGKYHGQWTLAGRLQRPLVEINAPQMSNWLATHPEGRIVFVLRQPEQIPAGARVEYSRRYRGSTLAILAPQ
jgi:4-amino-4-deoxy-L-arabinose transferase-like glycosyltransferase